MTLTLDILDLHQKYAHLPEKERWRVVREIEMHFHDFGLQFRPESQLHERSTWTMGLTTGYGRAVYRKLILSGIPDEVVHEAWAEILPVLPEHKDETPDDSEGGGKAGD